jgi:hypothetical protein
MNRLRRRDVGVFLATLLMMAPGASAQRPSTKAPTQPSLAEQAVARVLAANPTIAPYQLGTSLDRQGRVVVSGRVGAKVVYDLTIRTLIDTGIPFVDRLVIDTGLGVPVVAQPVAVAQPLLYPPPLMGRVDEPFLGFEPPVIAYPPWWGALDAQRRAEVAAPAPAPSEPGPPQPYTNETPGPAPAEMPPPPPRPFNEQPAGNPPPPPPPPRPPVPMPPAPGVPTTAAVASLLLRPGSIESRINQALRRALPADVADQVQVNMSGDVATLAGAVPSVYEAMLAFRAVETTPGVSSLVDRLRFPLPEPGGQNPLITRARPQDVEPYLKAQLERHLGDQAQVDQVRVQADLLQIEGAVPEANTRDRVLAIVRSLPILRGYRIDPNFRTR